MNNILKYKGYIGSVNFDADDRIFHGRVMGIKDIIGFEGSTVNELEQDLHNAVDDYLETCLEIGKQPEISKNLFCYEDLLKIRYEIIIYWNNEDKSFIAEVPELPGCMAKGATYQEALQNAEIIISEWIETAKTLDRHIPEPKGKRLMYA